MDTISWRLEMKLKGDRIQLAEKSYRSFKDDSEAEAWGQKNYKDWANSLSDMQKYDIQTYQQTEDGFSKINAFARGDKTWVDGAGQVHKLDGADLYAYEPKVASIREALEKAIIPEDVHVFRATDSLHELGMPLKDIDDGIIDMEFPVKGFKSTSLVPDKLSDFVGIDHPLVLEIDIPQGAHGAYLNALGTSEHLSDERELLLADRGKMVVTGRGTRYLDDIGEVAVVFMRLVP